MASVVLEEKVDSLRVSYLLDVYTFEQFYSAWEGNKTDAKKEYEKTMRYLNKKISSSNNYVKYNYCKNRTSGRLIGDFTIQSIRKEIRGFICDGITTDIDMNNAHPRILLTLCEIYDIQAPNLALYINDRKKCLNDIQEKDCLTYFKAKQKVLISTNLDKKISTKSDFLKNYDREMKMIHKKFLDVEDFAYVKDFAKKDNFEGSFINHILCINENEILASMRNFCDTNNIKIQSLMFDGLMVYGNINDFTLKQMEKYIQENTIFTEMELSIKEHEYDFKLPNGYVPKERITYEDVKKDFEKLNCKVGAEFVNEKHNDFNVYNKATFNILHEEMTFTTDDGEEKSFIDKWFMDKVKRKYDKYDTIPKDSMCPDHIYNMWEKLPVELMPSLEETEYYNTALLWFQNHIRVLVDFNETHYNFVVMWLAQMFQYPENKSIQLVFVGDEGAGKGTFIKFLTTMMGGGHRCFSTEDPQNDIFGQFNDYMKKAFLVVMDEADKSGTYNNNNKLKGLITEPFINIRPKGKTAFSMRSVHRFMGFSNNPDPTTKNKRRDFTMKTSSCKINNIEYFIDGNKYANNINCCKYIYDWLMKQQTKPNITEKDIPKGIYDEILKEAQKDAFIEFMEDLVYSYTNITEPKTFIANVLYEMFIDFCNRNHITYIQNKVSFLTKLSYKNFNGMTRKVKKIEGKTFNCYVFDFQKLKKSLNVVDVEEECMIEETDSDTYTD
tara:strand:+ start:1269 stop:3437 length:2169 start_codon:yes stop_codon:yes gene_type:complete